MDFWVVLGSVGSIASVVGLMLPVQAKYQRAMHAVYGLAIALLSMVAVWYWQENSHIRNVERAATALVKDFDHQYTSEGFVQAALAFLEKNKDLYPDAYSRAQLLVSSCECQYSSKVVGLSYALNGLIKGISTLEGGTK